MESASSETPKEPIPAESADTTTSSSHDDTADLVVPPTPDSATQSKDSDAPIVEPDQSQPETKVVEDMAVDSSDQPSSGWGLNAGELGASQTGIGGKRRKEKTSGVMDDCWL